MRLFCIQAFLFLAHTTLVFSQNGLELKQQSNESNESYIFRLRQEDQKGNLEASYELGDLYYNGVLLEKNEIKAFEFYQRASNGNSIRGIFATAYCYQTGKGVSPDIQKAIALYKKSTEQRVAKSAYSLGLIYAKGLGVAPDFEQATYWFDKCLSFNDLKYNIMVAKQYFYSRKGTPYADRGLRILQDLADHDNTEAQSFLGTCYYIQPETYDRDKAFYYLDKAAAKGDRDALCVLGQMYLRGDAKGGKDEKKGLASLRASADKGDSEAMAILGAYYLARKRDTKGGLEKGLAYLEKGAALDSPTAQYELGLLYTSGTYVPKDEATGVALLEKSAAGGDDRAQLEMATRYGQGQGVPLDFDRMKALLEASAAQGNLEAKGLLKKLSAVGEARAALGASVLNVEPDAKSK